MTIKIGELNNNLVTNTYIIDDTPEEVSGQVLLELEFKDYTGRKLVPTELVVRKQETAQESTITSTESNIIFGRRGETFLQSSWKLNDNIMTAVAAQVTGQALVTSVFNFQLISLTTVNNSFTRFKFA